MADKKNQHFVPKVYLRAFSPDQEENDSNKKTINIWLYKYDKLVTGASIRNQCSRSYFYGSDLILENLFRFPEGLYGKVKNKILSGTTLNNEDLYVILFFWLIQHTRAERYLASQVAAMSSIRQKVLLGHEHSDEELKIVGAPMTEQETAKLSLASAKEFIGSISDLKKVLLSNRTRIPFVTSDNPAVSSNRLIIQRYNGLKNWGLNSAGCYLYLPVSPNYAFIAYDHNVYTLDGRKGKICELNEKDVNALNQLIFLNCDNCVFFNDESFIGDIVESFQHVIDLKSDELFKLNIAVRDREYSSGTHKKYKVASDEEFAVAREGLLHLESRPPQIRNHFSKLRYKHQPRYIDTRTGAGWIRYTLDVTAKNRLR